MDLTINNSKLILAPIAGFSDCGLRSLSTHFGAGLCFTEMVSALALHYKNKQTEELLTLSKDEMNTGVQLFGSNPSVFSEVVEFPILSKFKIIDINCGCPVPKVYKNGDGSALMKTPEKISDIVKAIKKSTPEKLVTVKLRKGSEGRNNYIECGLAAQESGASLVTLHGRTREEMYSGKVDLESIALLKQALTIPVSGNGDVTNKDSYKNMLDTGVDYVTIARGAIGNPQIFAELQGKKVEVSIKELILKHIDFISFLPAKVQLNQMKAQISHYVKGKRNSKQFKDLVFKTNSIEELKLLITNSEID
ncbi:MAG: tRNA-dihydrouridine synthase family protein [Clostridia bacterium]|nr:tRNA-dihydrouridine synthase family protein [Clostridia bacterium]